MDKLISLKKLREFGILFGILFPIFIGLLVPLIYGHPFRVWTIFPGIIHFFLAFLKPESLYYPYKLWMKLGMILGWINSRLILGMIFVLVVQPISLFMKLFGYDPLRKNTANLSTYREVKKNYKIDLTRIF